MKKITFITIALFLFIFTNAQDVTFGIKGGLNYSTITYNGTGITDANQPDSKPAFHFGGFAEISINDKFSIQPELLLTAVGEKSEEIIGGNTEKSSQCLCYLSIPVMAKYYVTDNISVEAGPHIGFLLMGMQTLSINGNEQELPANNDPKEGFETLDYGIAFGAGYKLDNGLSFNARYVLGLANTLEDPSPLPPNYDLTRKGNVFQLSVGYAFK